MPIDQQHLVSASPKLGLLEYMLTQHRSLIILSVDQMQQHNLHRITPAVLPLVGKWRDKYETSFCMPRSEFDMLVNRHYGLISNQEAILELTFNNIEWRGRLMFRDGGFTWVDGSFTKLDKDEHYLVSERDAWTYDPSSDDFYVFR